MGQVRGGPGPTRRRPDEFTGYRVDVDTDPDTRPGWEISHHDFLSHPHPERVFLGDGTPPEGVARADRGRAGHAAALDPAPEAPAR